MCSNIHKLLTSRVLDIMKPGKAFMIGFVSFLLVLLLSADYALAQTTNISSSSRRSSFAHRGASIRHYVDSLRLLRDSLFASGKTAAVPDSLSRHKPVSRMEHYDVLTPLTFYHGVPHRLFSLDSVSETRSLADRALMSMYLAHPEMVFDTDGRIRQNGDIEFKPQEPVKNDVVMTSQTEETPIIITTPADIPNSLDLVTVRPNFWKYVGDYSLQFIQNYVSGNWYKGGTSSYAMIGAATIQLNYNDKEKVKWDNKLEMKLGMQSAQGDSLHDFKSTEDLIRLTSKLGIQASRKWYYTLQGIFSTQFTHGYKSNDPVVYSDFLSPLNVNLSLGMDYKINWLKGRLTGTVNISPLAGNMKYVDRLGLAQKYGIDEGHHTLWDLGSTFTTDVSWKFSPLISLKSRLYAYTTYHRTEVEWENTLTFQLSKFISTQLFVYPRFDDSAAQRDDTYGYFQLKEYWSLGFTFSL